MSRDGKVAKQQGGCLKKRGIPALRENKVTAGRQTIPH